MKFKVDFDVELSDEALDALVDYMEDKLIDAIAQIEEEQIQSIIDLTGEVVPVFDSDEEMMEKAFDLVQKIQYHVFWTAMKRWNLPYLRKIS